MRGKLLFITGGLIGYVLGARAGRKRYEQIKSAADSFWNAEPVQRRVGDVRDFALDKVGDVPGALFDAGKKVVNSVMDKAGSGNKASSGNKDGSGGKSGSGSAPPRPTTTTAAGSSGQGTDAQATDAAAADWKPTPAAGKSSPTSKSTVKPTSTRAKSDPSDDASDA